MSNTTIKEIYNYIDTIAPFNTQCEWDNSGLLAGDANAAVKRVLVCLDATNNAINSASKNGCELIVTHHPLIFRAIKEVPAQSAVYNLIRNGMSVICAHTNLDAAAQGVNLRLAEALGLKDIHIIENMEFGFGGELPVEMDCRAFAKYVGERLGTVCRASVCERQLRRVAVVGGGAGDMAQEAFAIGYDAFVTGEVKHHEFIAAAEEDRCVVAAGHYETENVVVEPLRNMLAAQFGDVEFITYHENLSPCVYISE